MVRDGDLATNLPNFHHLRHFWIVAQEGSLFGASRKLGLRHSTLSAQMQRLERQLGATLLLRQSRGIELTPQGETVRRYCDQIFSLGAELIELNTHGQITRLRVGALASVPRSLLYSVLQIGLDGLRLELSITNVDAAATELLTGRLDVVITDRVIPQRGSSFVESHVVGRSRVGLYATRTLAERYRPGFPRSLDDAPLLMPARGPLGDVLTSWFAEEQIRPRVVAEFDDVPTMEGFAARGHGIVPARLPLAHEARHGLVSVGAVPNVWDKIYAFTAGTSVRHPAVQFLLARSRSIASVG